MGVLSFLFSSSIGRKLVMAVTGVSLIAFLVVHCAINACVYFMDEGATFNAAAEFMAHNWFIRLAEVGLIGGLLIHIVQGLSLTLDNMKKRNNKYGAAPKRSNSTWYSRSMGLLGTILLLFLVMHLKDFWIVSRFDAQGGLTKTKTLYHFMVEVFTNPVPVTLYVLGCISLAYHLLHGFQSAFQTFGLNHPILTPMIKTLGVAFSIIVPLVCASIPVVLHLDLIK